MLAVDSGGSKAMQQCRPLKVQMLVAAQPLHHVQNWN